MKYRRQILTPEVELSFKDICLEIEQKHEIRFLEIGVADEHVHMLVQGIPTMPVTRMVAIIKSLTEREICTRHPSLKKNLLWSS